MNIRRCVAALLTGLTALAMLAADAPEAPSEKPDTASAIHLITVPLPIVGSVDTLVKRRLDAALRTGDVVAGRPLLILEFRGRDGNHGEGSEFERSLSLARYLASVELRRARTIAFLPESLYGHAVLPALACEELIMSEDAEIGAAGQGEATIDAAMVGAYEEIARRRRTVPALVAKAMLSKELAVYKVVTLDGVKFVDAEGLEQLRETAAISDEQTIVREGDFAKLNGADMRVEYGFASQLAADRQELARVLNAPPTALLEDLQGDAGRAAVRVDLQGRITAKNIQETLRSLQNHLSQGDASVLFVVIDSPGGSPADSMALANYLSELPAQRIRTIAYVPRQARGDAALPALACDQLVMGEEAVLGGPGDYEPSEQERIDMRDPVQRIARAKQRDGSLLLGLADHRLVVHRYLRDGNGPARYLSEQEWDALDDSDRWQRKDELNLRQGLGPVRAGELGVARHVVGSFAELQQLYDVDQVNDARPPAVIVAIERLASQPWLARTLLFIAFFSFMSEASAPGLGAPGFVSLVCFLLFFWIQFFNGAAGWLEVILFAGGLLCLAVELLVLPGFGVFGIGGVLMVLSSILLATQTFVLPQNRYQYEQVPGSLFTVITAMAGTLAAIWTMRHVLPRAPILRKLVSAPMSREAVEDLKRRESVVNYDYLLHKAGTTTTQLTPSGKARFGDDVIDVISDGEVIPKGSQIVVSEVLGNRILVESLDQRV